MLRPNVLIGCLIVFAGAAWAFAAQQPNQGEQVKANGPPDSEPVAVGVWSEPVKGLRGRLVIAKGKLSANGTTRESVVYLDLHHFADAVGKPHNVYVDPNLPNELYDPSGKKLAPGGVPGSGGRPGPQWVRLPYDCSMRFRLSPYGFGRANGLLIPFNGNQWVIPADAQGEYALAATFTSKAPADDSRDAWQGTLTLPKLKITLSK